MENITSPELQELGDHKFTHNIKSLQDSYLYDGEFNAKNKKKEHNKEYLSYVNNSEYIGTFEVKCEVKCEGFRDGGYPWKYILPNIDSHGTLYILKNLRFKNKKDSEKVDQYMMQLGGQTFDKFERDFYTQLQSFYEMDEIPFHIFKNGAPPHLYHQNIIYLYGKNLKDVVLVVDRYIGDVLPDPLEYLTYRNSVQNKDGNPNLDMGYFIMANKNIHNIVIHLSVPSGKEYTFKLKQDDNGMINLTNDLKLEDFSTYCMNFSYIHSRLSYNCDDDKVIIGSLCSSIVIIKSGMVGFKYIMNQLQSTIGSSAK